MARVTIEDCLDKIPNRFELVVLASERARALQSGDVSKTKKSLLNCHNKSLVVALREIANGFLDLNVLKENILTRYCMNKRFNSLVTVSLGDSSVDALKTQMIKNTMNDTKIDTTEEISLDSDAFTVTDEPGESSEYR